MAASIGAVAILDSLIKAGADLDAADDLGDTVLHSAVRIDPARFCFCSYEV